MFQMFQMFRWRTEELNTGRSSRIPVQPREHIQAQSNQLLTKTWDAMKDVFLDDLKNLRNRVRVKRQVSALFKTPEEPARRNNRK